MSALLLKFNDLYQLNSCISCIVCLLTIFEVQEKEIKNETCILSLVRHSSLPSSGRRDHCLCIHSSVLRLHRMSQESTIQPLFCLFRGGMFDAHVSDSACTNGRIIPTILVSNQLFGR